jgi:hypothetical protein
MTVIVGSARYAGADDRTWIFGLINVVFSGGILLFMPIIRGYPVVGRGDVLTHIGFIKDISVVGIEGNMYPAMHLLVYSASLATGLGPGISMQLLSIVVSFAFLGGMFYLVQNFYSRTHALYALPFVLILFVGYTTAKPFVLSVLYVPFVMYLFIKEQRTSVIPIRTFLIFSIFGIIFFHPLTSVFLILTLGIYVGLEKTTLFSSQWSTPTMVPSLTVVVFSTWYLAFLGIIRRFETVAQRFSGSLDGQSELDTVTQTVNTYSPDPLDLVTIAVLEYGLEVILYSLAGLFVLLAAYLWLRNEIELNIFIVLFSGVFILFTFLSVLFFFNNFLIGWGRVLFFENFFAAVLSASFFYFLFQHLSHRGIKTGVTVSLGVVLFVLTLLVVFTAFSTVPAREHNDQVTEMEIDGTEYILENRNDEMSIDQNRISLWRYENYHNGTLTETIPQESGPYDHFGYDINTTIGQSYPEDRYLITNELGRLTYPVLYDDYPDYWRFTPEDFARLENDPTAGRIYDNGEFDLYHVTAQQGVSSDPLRGKTG